MKKSIGNYNGKELYLTIAKYSNNNRIYVAVETEEDLYADITINLSDMVLPGEEYAFANGDTSKELRKFLEDKGIISEPIETYQYNMGRYDMIKLNFELLKEYDSEEFNQYEKSNDDDIEL